MPTNAADSPYTFQPVSPTVAGYRALAALLAHVYPRRTWSAERLLADDERQRRSGFFERYEGRVHGRLEGAGTIFQLPGNAPGNFSFGFVVRPGYEETPLPGALQAHLLQQLAPHRPVTVSTRVQESVVYRVRLLEEAGFDVARRIVSSELDVAAFDPRPYAAARDNLAADGVDVIPLADWVRPGMNWQQQCWGLIEAERDAPGRGDWPVPAWYHGLGRLLDDPDTELAAWGVARDRQAAEGEQLVGLSMASRLPTRPHVLASGLTLVAGRYRRRGIALVLKLQTIDYARRRGFRLLRTENDSENPLLALNLQLGFVPEPALVDYVKHAGELIP